MRLSAILLKVLNAEISVLGKAVSQFRPRDLRHDFTDCRVVDAQYREAIEREIVQEIDKGLFESIEITAVGAHVVGFDISDNCHHGQ